MIYKQTTTQVKDILSTLKVDSHFVNLTHELHFSINVVSYLNSGFFTIENNGCVSISPKTQRWFNENDIKWGLLTQDDDYILLVDSEEAAIATKLQFELTDAHEYI